MNQHSPSNVRVVGVAARAALRASHMYERFVSLLRLGLRFDFWIAVIIAFSAGAWLRWTVLDAGFFSDDFDHYAMRNGVYPVERSHLDMFNFSDGSRAENRVLMQSGHFPWWTHERVHLSMWRPLSSALMSLDFAVFGSNARMFHVHSMLWWAVLVLAVGTVLWQVLPKPAAAVAIVLFAIEEGHGLPVAWPANRSTLIASAFGFFALALHLRWRAHGRAVDRAGFIGCSLLALGAGEYAFTPFAYLAAYELSRPGTSVREIARAVWPAAVGCGVYLLVRERLGYGIEGSGFYISPTGTPLAFLEALAWRVPVLVGDLMFGVAADWYVLGTPWRDEILDWDLFSPEVWYALPDWHTWQVTIGAVGLALLAALAWILPRWAGDERARTVRWLIAGALLSLVPVSGSMVSSRLTVAASVGFDALFGELIVLAVMWAGWGRGWGLRALAAVGCGLTLWVHGYRAGERSYDEANWYTFHAAMERDWILSADVDERKVASQHFIVFAAQDVMTSWYIPYLRMFEGRPRPRTAWLLSGAPQAHDLLRVADNAFELAVLSSDVERMAAGSNYRPADAPMAVGDEVKLEGMRVMVVAVRQGQPVRARFTFDAPLEDERYVFLHPTERGLRRVHLPAVGERIRIRRPTYPSREALRALDEDREASRRDGYGGALAPMYYQLFRP